MVKNWKIELWMSQKQNKVWAKYITLISIKKDHNSLFLNLL